MKKTFKIISLLLVVSMLLAFASCKPDDVTEEPTTTESEVVSTTEKTDDEEKGTLIVVVDENDYIPYKYKVGDKLTGIDFDFMNAVANKLNMNIEFCEGTKNETNNEDVDIPEFKVYTHAGYSDELSRDGFSNVYATDVQSVIVKASSEYMIYDNFYSDFDADGFPTGVKDGIKIGVRKNTTGDFIASAPLKEWGFGQENIKEFTSNEEMINALKNDEITAVVIDDALARNIVDKVSGLKILDSTFYSTSYRIDACEGNEEDNKVLKAINELIDDGTAQSIVDKYMEY